MKVLIIEDEKIAAEKLENMLHEIDPEIQVQAKLGSIRESVKWLMQNTTELIFLDIQLSDGISFKIFEQLAVSTPVIFTTAYDQYAIKAFQVNSISYLLKPIRKRELAESLQKFRSLKATFSIDFDALLDQLQGREPDFKKRFLIQIGDKIKKIEVSDIAYFYVFEKGIYIKTFSGNSYPVDFTLDKLEGLVDPGNFFRINRKYLVNMDSISNMFAYSRARVKLELEPQADDEYDTIVSIDRSADFKKWLNS
ncbi:LytR/AlgR family response regulator transcription factor [Sunxiuqinia sp. sy24]|uniref:LytR/AlgR family response regulator transcription factor n=1 Tax=Sunxiuqinia sp. sy24 TaxID=3461495 RepID=UPI0040454BAE